MKTKHQWITCILILTIITSIFSLSACTTQQPEEKSSTEYDAETKEIISRISTDTKDCELLEPFDADKSGPYDEVTLDFRQKTVISEGKFGYRKKLVLKERAFFRQYSYSDWNDMWYGVYRDPELTEPIEEVDTTYNNRAFGEMEEGADIKDYPNYKDGMIILLEPGTYYIGIFTSDPRSTYSVTYTSELLPINEEERLTEGSKSAYQVGPGEQIVYRSISAEKTGRIRVRTDSYCDSLHLCDSAKTPITKERKSKKHKSLNAVFCVTKGKNYYIKITCNRKEFYASDGIASYHIWFENID